MSAPLCFIDTETTSLRPDRRAWEIALILRNLDARDDREYTWFIDPDDLDLGNADPKSLDIGGYYQRHPIAGQVTHGWSMVQDEDEVLAQVEALTRGAHLVGNVVSFDADVLDRRMRERGLCPSWHHHLIDVEPMVVGYLAGLAAAGQDVTLPGLPWRSDDLSRAIGIDPDRYQRHTALGDAQWCRDMFDVAVGKGLR